MHYVGLQQAVSPLVTQFQMQLSQGPLRPPSHAVLVAAEAAITQFDAVEPSFAVEEHVRQTLAAVVSADVALLGDLRSVGAKAGAAITPTLTEKIRVDATRWASSAKAADASLSVRS